MQLPRVLLLMTFAMLIVRGEWSKAEAIREPEYGQSTALRRLPPVASVWEVKGGVSVLLPTTNEPADDENDVWL